ncbi:Neurabin-2 [Thelohanellus kitauei]|uniref:Neurabin-2 n=1 Tax=Thelohanellus kitauei TaxID=669202 RepID=A0A0C2M6W7_THEKT|nr:Neurabin-2 [Thelohanellus kitauei]
MLDRMNMIKVTLKKSSPDEKLGLSIYGVVIQTISEQNNSAIFVKSVIPGSLCDISGKVHVDDLLVEINGIPLIGLPVSKVYEIIQNSKTTIEFVLGRERKESGD